MNRREFLQLTGSTSLAVAAGCATSNTPSNDLAIIDCHTHFFDPTRPGGVPWPGKNSKLYKPTYPKNYLAQAVPQPVTGTVVVEASPQVEDNQWVLNLAKRNKFIVGFCGNLDPLDEKFAVNLDRFAMDRHYSGIRVSGDAVAENLNNETFIQNIGSIDKLNLQLDVNGPPNTLAAVAKLADRFPSLRIVIDHLANVSIDGKSVNKDWRRDMENVSKHPHVFAKVSGLVEAGARSRKPASVDTDYYAPHLDVLWKAFGEDRLVYGSNWPVCGLFAPLHDVQRIVSEYFNAKGQTAPGKVFAGNTRVAYALS